MKPSHKDRGITMVFVILLMVIALPLALLGIRKTMGLNRSLWSNRIGAASRQTADNLIVDYMSQFSKGSSYYENHFDVSSLQRTRTFFETGFASVDVQASPVSKTIQISARGEYASGATSAPKSSKGLEALIHFVPLIGQYSWQLGGGYAIAIPGMTMQGPVRVEGGLQVLAGNVTFDDTVIAGSINSALNPRFRSQVFYQTSYSPAQYDGGLPIQGIPPGGSFVIENDYYQVNSTTFSIGINTAWNFRVNGGGTAQYRSRYDLNNNYSFDPGEDWGPWENIPVAGGIFFVQNAKTWISGIVGARVTVVCSGPPTSGTFSDPNNMGMIEVIGPYFGYPLAGGNLQPFANANQSIFVIATHGFVFTLPSTEPLGTVLRISGAYALTQGRYDDGDCAALNPATIVRELAALPTADNSNFLGSLNYLAFCSHFTNPPVSTFDPNLQRFPAPGVPERPVLLGWRRRN